MKLIWSTWHEDNCRSIGDAHKLATILATLLDGATEISEPPRCRRTITPTGNESVVIDDIRDAVDFRGRHSLDHGSIHQPRPSATEGYASDRTR